MELKSLGYVGVRSPDPSAWADLATTVLGMQVVPGHNGVVRLRMDDRHHRISVEVGAEGRVAFHGWEVEGPSSLQAAAAELEGAGVDVRVGTEEEREQRRVADLVWFYDPAGHRIEIFHGLEAGDGAFTPGRDMAGFVTGALGLGHLVPMVPDLAGALRFYQERLGFRLSDYVRAPLNAAFLHVNPRHHSLALLEAAVPVPTVHHVMVEVADMDDVGLAFDLAQAQGIPLVTSLGRHSNDFMFSFYLQTPSGFEIEYGWGGRLVDDATWEPAELTEGFTLWGHAGR